MTTEPERIGRYVIEAVLGRGAMGVVYKAHDPEIDRTVAVKLVRADLLDGQERADYLARLRREAQAAGRCMHPNIVALYDYAVHDGNPFLVMEYVKGMSLAQVLERGARFRPDEAIFIVTQLLEALGCAHAQGVVHRDVKPANILLLEGGRVKVTDFGISRLEASTLTQSGSIVGTPSYMSPEQCRGEEVDARSDLFSAGVVLHELLAGERPFPGRSVSVLTKQVLYDEPPDLAGRVPERLAACVRRALAKRPEDRFASAEDMASALRAARQAAADEMTVVQPPPARSEAAPAGQSWADEQVLSTLQRRLASHVGPIAKVLLGSAIRKASSLEALCDLLAESIEKPEERQTFLREARRDFGASVSSVRSSAAPIDASSAAAGGGRRVPAAPASVISQRSVEVAQAELSRLIGPIARVLVKRALTSARTTAELWATLAAHIERPEERAAFRRTQPREDG